jgi:hypothetical protein
MLLYFILLYYFIHTHVDDADLSTKLQGLNKVYYNVCVNVCVCVIRIFVDDAELSTAPRGPCKVLTGPHPERRAIN